MAQKFPNVEYPPVCDQRRSKPDRQSIGGGQRLGQGEEGHQGSTPIECANAARMLASAKTISPTNKVRRRPNASVSRPATNWLTQPQDY